MDERKKIDLQQHISPKASRKYLVKILIYAALLGGLITLIYFVGNDRGSSSDPSGKKAPLEKDLDSTEIRGVTIED